MTCGRNCQCCMRILCTSTACSVVICILAFVVGMVNHLHWTYTPDCPFNSNTNSPITNCANQFFSTDYNSARQKFLEFSAKLAKIKNINAKTYNFPIYHIPNTNKETLLETNIHDLGKTLHTDITIINDNQKSTNTEKQSETQKQIDSKSDHLLIHISGTHGTEGYAGSAIQIKILQDILKNPSKYIGNDKPIIVLVHAMNPFGFYYSRRTNEDNIDLNRNLKTTSEWNTFLKMDPNKHDYVTLNGFFNPDFHLLSFVQFLKTFELKLQQIHFLKNNNDLNIVSKIVDFIEYLYLQGVYYSYWIKYGYYWLVEQSMTTIHSAMIAGQSFDEYSLQFVGYGPNKHAKSHQILLSFLFSRLMSKKAYKNLNLDLLLNKKDNTTNENNVRYIPGFNNTMPFLFQNESNGFNLFENIASNELIGSWHEQIKRITVVDVHTGLGPMGIDTLLTVDERSKTYLESILTHVCVTGIVDNNNNEQECANDDDDDDTDGYGFEKGMSMVKNVYADKSSDDSFVGGAYKYVTGVTSNLGLLIVENFLQTELKENEKQGGKDESKRKKINDLIDFDYLYTAQEFGTYDEMYSLRTNIHSNAFFSVKQKYINECQNDKSGNDYCDEFVLNKLEKYCKEQGYAPARDQNFIDDYQWKRSIVKRGFKLFDRIRSR